MTIDELLVSVGFKFTGQAGLEAFRQAIADLQKDLQPLAASLNQVGDLTAAFANQAAAAASSAASVTQEATAQAAALDQVTVALETVTDQSGAFAGQTIVAADAATQAVAGITAHRAALAQAALAATQAATGVTSYATQTVQAGAAAAAATAQVQALTAAQAASGGGTPTAPNAPTPPPAKNPNKKANAELKEKFGRVKEIAKEMAKYTAIAYGAAAATAAFVLKLSKTNDELNLAAQNLKISASELSAWNGAAKIVLGASADMAESFEKLKMTAVNARMEGGQAAAAFASLGVQTHTFTGELKGENEIMMGIVDGLDRLPDRQMKLWRLNQLGLAHMLPFFEKGRAAIEAMMQEQKDFGPTPDQLSKTREFMMLFQRFQLYVGNLANTFVSELQPVFGGMMKEFIAWVQVNKEFLALKIKEFVQGIAAGLWTLVLALKFAYGAFMLFSDIVGGVDHAVWILLAGLMALAAVMTGALIASVAALVSLLVLLAPALLAAAEAAFLAMIPAIEGMLVAAAPFLAVILGIVAVLGILHKLFKKSLDLDSSGLDEFGKKLAALDGKTIENIVKTSAINPAQIGTAAIQNAQTSSAAGLLIAQQNTNTSRNLSKMEVAVNVTGDARGLDVAQLGKILSERLSFEVEQATLNLNSGVTA